MNRQQYIARQIDIKRITQVAITCLSVMLLFQFTGIAQSNNKAIFYLNPKWSPDGKQIAFTSDFEGKSAIYVMSETGDNLTRITDSSFDSGLPAWSPDGKALIYHRIVQPGLLQLFIYHIPTQAERQLIAGPTVDYAANWSKEGRIIYNSRDSIGGLNHTIRISDITGDHYQLMHDDYDYSAPAWSPDGQFIVCIRTTAMKTSFKETPPDELNRIRKSSEIIMLTANGDAFRNLSNDTVANRCPSFSADGSKVYFMSRRDSGFAVMKMDMLTQKTQLVFVPAGVTSNFSVSPGGSYFTYSSFRNGTYGIYTWDNKRKKKSC